MNQSECENLEDGAGGGGGQEGPLCGNIILMISGSKMCGIPVRCAFKLYKQ